jgi:HK97 family phage major capsid protein
MASPMTREDIAARQNEIASRMQEIDTEYRGVALPEQVAEEFKQLDEERDSLRELDQELEFRSERIKQAAVQPENRESGAHFHTARPRAVDNIWDLASVRAQSRSAEEESRMLEDNTKRAIEQMHFPHESANREAAQGHIERLLNKVPDMTGERQQFARHILATGSPTYRKAFGKALGGAPLTAEESRAMSLTSASGGYAVPVTLDPTIIPTSNGAVNPWRAISRVEQITGNTWNGVSAGAVVASRDLEFEEVSDDSPTLAQPTATVTKAQAFIPFSIEVGQDWGSRTPRTSRRPRRSRPVRAPA